MEKKVKYLVVLAAINIMAILVANLAATKLWIMPFFNIAVDGGLIVFPITYIVGDIVVELYGKKAADQIVWMAMIFNLVATILLIIVGALPSYPGWEGQESYMAILGTAAPRITLASLTAYVASGLMNNFVFEKIRNYQRKKQFARHKRTTAEMREYYAQMDEGNVLAILDEIDTSDKNAGYTVRAIGSSIVGRIIDNVLFETIAFVGILPFTDFVWQTVGAFVEGLIIELILTMFVSKHIVRAVRKRLEDKSLKNKNTKKRSAFMFWE